MRTCCAASYPPVSAFSEISVYTPYGRLGGFYFGKTPDEFHLFEPFSGTRLSTPTAGEQEPLILLF